MIIDDRHRTIDNATIGPFCAVCGKDAGRLLTIGLNCYYCGWGQMVCMDCCAACDLHYGCAALAAFRRARRRPQCG